MQSSEWNLQFEYICREPLLASAATSWIVLWNLLPETERTQTLKTHVTTMLETAVKSGQIEHLRYFWDKLPVGIERPNLAYMIDKLIANSLSANTVSDVFGFLHKRLPDEEFFAWDELKLADKKRQLRWLSKHCLEFACGKN